MAGSRILLLLLALLPQLAAANGGFEPVVDLRLRSESVRQDNVLRDADALTLRARLGLDTPAWRGLRFGIDAEAVANAGDDYNSGPGGNRATAYAVVADPEGAELNQAWVDYAGLPATQLRLGRQRLILDRARFVGNVGWRQNEQSFDALHIDSTPRPGTRLRLAYLTQVHDIFFRRRGIDAPLLELSHTLAPAATIAGYAHWLDFDAGPDQATYGLRLTGDFAAVGLEGAYRLEYARQRPHAEAPDSVQADYHHLTAQLARQGFVLALGQETLGGDGVYGFATPLATLHAYNGWADQFLSTPAAGLRDRYARLQAPLGPVKFTAVFHDFSAATGGADYGREGNFSAAWQSAAGLELLLKFADYRARRHAVDTRKSWLQLSYRL